MIKFMIYFCVPFLCQLISIDCSHVCELLENSYFDPNFISGFSTPSPTGNQSYFLVIKDYYCELEAKYDSTDLTQFGYSFGFKNNKTCKKHIWRHIKPESAQFWFSIRFGNPESNSADERNWKRNSIVKADWQTNNMYYSVYPIGTNPMEPNINDINEIAFDIKGFKPSIAYNVYSRQEQNSIAFIEQKYYKNESSYFLRFQVYNSSDLSLGMHNETDYANNNDPGPRFLIPKALTQTNRSIYVIAMFGISLPKSTSNPNQSNGTIILVRWQGPYYRKEFRYCVTQEYVLSSNCELKNQKLFIDCKQDITTIRTIGTTKNITIKTTSSGTVTAQTVSKSTVSGETTGVHTTNGQASSGKTSTEDISSNSPKEVTTNGETVTQSVTKPKPDNYSGPTSAQPSQSSLDPNKQIGGKNKNSGFLLLIVIITIIAILIFIASIVIYSSVSQSSEESKELIESKKLKKPKKLKKQPKATGAPIVRKVKSIDSDLISVRSDIQF